MTIPWIKHPETKTPHQQLLDILTPLGGLMEDFLALERTVTNEEELRAQVRPSWEKCLE